MNPTYSECAAYYGMVIVPARKGRPKDKAKVEAGVRLIQMSVLAHLRHRVFYSLEELNRAVAVHIEAINNKLFKKLPGATRRSLFESLDRPALLPLPSCPYEFAEWRIGVRVGPDYHVEWDQHYYSLPYTFVSAQVEIKITPAAVTVFHRHKRVALHKRSFVRGGATTLREHQPRAHQHYAEDQAGELIVWADAAGRSIAKLIRQHLERIDSRTLRFSSV